MGGQLLGNSSQHSQQSHHSHESQQNQNQGMMSQQMQGGSQLASQAHQDHLHTISDSSQNNMQMNNVQNQSQRSSLIHDHLGNQMQNTLDRQISDGSHQLHDLDSSLRGNQDPLQQALSGASGGMEHSEEIVLDVHSAEASATDVVLGDDDENPASSNVDAAEDSKPAEIGSQSLDDNSNRSTGSKSKNIDPSESPPPTRTVVPRGRGGKGKRLREIADDLMPGPGAATSMEADGSRKRNADEMATNTEGDSSSKSQKLDGSLPDKETSSGENGQSKDGENHSSSLASSMPKGDVEQHLLMLHKGLHLTSRTITHKCLPIVQQLIDDPYGWVFRDAVDPVVFGLPDYFEVVKNPMHLLLVKKKLENAVYTDMASFERDVKLVFENAILYNGEDSEVGTLAKTMMGVFEKEYKKVCEGM